MSFPPRIKYGINSSGNPVLLIMPSVYPNEVPTMYSAFLIPLYNNLKQLLKII